MIACVRSLGQDPEDLDLIEGIDVVFVALNAFPPRICAITDFYGGLFEKEPAAASEKLEAGLNFNPQSKQIFGGKIQSAEQFDLLAKAGYIRDLRKKKDG